MLYYLRKEKIDSYYEDGGTSVAECQTNSLAIMEMPMSPFRRHEDSCGLLMAFKREISGKGGERHMESGKRIK